MPAERPPLLIGGRVLGMHAAVQIGHQLADQVAQFLARVSRPLRSQLRQPLVAGHRLLQVLLHHGPASFSASSGTGLAVVSCQGYHQG